MGTDTNLSEQEKFTRNSTAWRSAREAEYWQLNKLLKMIHPEIINWPFKHLGNEERPAFTDFYNQQIELKIWIHHGKSPVSDAEAATNFRIALHNGQAVMQSLKDAGFGVVLEGTENPETLRLRVDVPEAGIAEHIQRLQELNRKAVIDNAATVEQVAHDAAGFFDTVRQAIPRNRDGSPLDTAHATAVLAGVQRELDAISESLGVKHPGKWSQGAAAKPVASASASLAG